LGGEKVTLTCCSIPQFSKSHIVVFLRIFVKICMNNLISIHMKKIAGILIFFPGIINHSGNLAAQSNSSLLPDYKTKDGKNYAVDDLKNSKWFWDFNKWNDREGWVLPEILNGTVTGGTLWLTIQSEPKKDAQPSWKDQVWGSVPNYELVSPKELQVPAEQYNKIVFRLRNLSPETDGFVRWQTTAKPGMDTGSVHFTMKPDCKEWQDVICHMDNRWKGTIDRIKILPAQMWQRGDMWIDWIAVTRGENKMAINRPDVCSDKVIPQIQVPGIAQHDFAEAFKVLDECLVTDVPVNGFNYPFMSPGGAYGTNWWQLDGSLNVAGAKWANQQLTEDVMRGFAGVQAQNPDGRIDLWGGSTGRGQFADVSSLPRYFEAAYDVARRSNDSSLQGIIFESMKKYLGYWFSASKRNQETGLITGVFEETLSNLTEEVGAVAPIDLNVAVAIGCYNTSLLAKHLGKIAEADKFLNDFKQLSSNINLYLWNDEDNIYCNYNVHSKQYDKRLICTTFDPLLLGIAPPDRVEKLIPVLLNPLLFYWGNRPLTTIARTEPGFVEATGTYDGRAWFGDIWTLRNLPVIHGLENVGKHDLAAELAWTTIKTFNAKYCEFIVPTTGSGEGVQRYGWSASQYIQAVIEDLFGIDCDCLSKRLRIIPHIPSELLNQEITINNVRVPSLDDVRLNLKIIQQGEGKATITVILNGELPREMIEIGLPGFAGQRVALRVDQVEELQTAVQMEDLTNVAGIRTKMRNHIQVTFE
jgi:hypothetical protein